MTPGDEPKNPKKKQSYVQQPEVDPEVAERMAVVAMILAGELTVTEGARRLGLSRPRMQTLKNRALAAMAGAVAKQRGGRPSTDEATKLRKELEQLEADHARLEKELEIAEDTMVNLVDMIKEQGAENRALKRTSRSRARKTKSKKRTGSNDEDDALRLARARQLAALGISSRAARAAIASRKSVRRWEKRDREGRPLVQKRGPKNRPPPSPQLRGKAEQTVRTMNGAISADALSKAVVGLSRRDAAAIRDHVRTELERERIERCGRVVVAAPNVLRGMDAMHLLTDAGRAFALMAADGAVSYRTTAMAVERYDSDAVEATVEHDLETMGRPLAYRLDRASCQKNPRLHALMKHHGVLHLHGPPRHPQYYGQHERMNRENRAFLGDQPLDRSKLPETLDAMTFALNEILPRRSLNWCTAAEIWSARTPLDIDRQALREEVEDRAQRIQALADKPLDPELAWRLAVEQVLIQHQLIQLQPGRRC